MLKLVQIPEEDQNALHLSKPRNVYCAPQDEYKNLTRPTNRKKQTAFCNKKINLYELFCLIDMN